MSKRLKIGIITLVVFIIATIVSSYLLLHGDTILVNFEITNISNDYTDYTIAFNKVKAADHYVIQIHDSESRKVYELSTIANENEIALTNLKYGEKYSVMVYAYDSLGDYRPCEETKYFVWNEPSIDKNNTILLNNEDYILFINGEVENKNYYIELYDGENLLKKEKLNDNEYTISNELYNGLEKQIDVKLTVNNVVIDSISLFNNMNPVSDIVIKTPITDSVVTLNDFTLSYDGGDNAIEYIIKIYKGTKCIKTTKTSRKTVILSKNLFSISNEYKIEVTGVYEDFSKSSFVNIMMSDKAQENPVYISNNWKYVKRGSKISLYCNSEDATIYYTLDGSNPESFGHVYTEPIEITENVTLKTVAVSEKKYNSIINTYDINVGEKENLKIYLSPSNQGRNYGVHSTGFTNERDEMNDLSNYIQERLESYGVKVYRNNSAGNINQWNKDSNYLGVDLHIAIHSNGSDAHNTYGIETWIDKESSATLSLANKIQKNLVSIYPYNELEGANRGVKYANGALGEANDNYIPFGMLIEVAHHDYESDALWIMQNKKLIGYNIADSIMEYYQIIS